MQRGDALLDVPTEYEQTSAEESPVERQQDHRVYLVVHQQGAARVIDVVDGSTVLFGRVPDATVQIDETKVSRRHAILRRSGDSLTIEDLGSRNGTKVNGHKISGTAIEVGAGDVIRVGRVDAAVAITEGAATAWERATDAPPASQASGGVVVADEAMVEVFRLARRLAGVQTTALILGETGVGKEVIAEQIHRWSSRASGPFVRLNCAALPESLLESELFGHERGAFTGAERRKAGYFEAAHGGTLFLDEVGELPLSTQVKLLNVLENRHVRRLGGTEDIAVDTRVIAATHRDLEKEVKRGGFREDLFYRLSAFTLRVPPLRERRVEVELLAEMFTREFARRAGVATPTISAAATVALSGHSWPGNVRELRNAIERAVVVAERGVIDVEHLPESLRADTLDDETTASGGPLSMDERLASVEKQALEEALAAEGGNQTRAAKRLGMSRSALIHRMKKHGLGR